MVPNDNACGRGNRMGAVSPPDFRISPGKYIVYTHLPKEHERETDDREHRFEHPFLTERPPMKRMVGFWVGVEEPPEGRLGEPF